MTDIQQLRKGSTPMLILSVLARGKNHGYAIMRELEERSEGYFSMTASLLYPALHQMELDGLVASEWEPGAGQRRRKVYAITPAGLERLASGQADWRQFIHRLSSTLGGSASAVQEQAK
jgi:PadR family transcriptional regulator, regulatory protein PadR